jgi:hypothetical protein
MISAHSLITRSIALLLPVCLIWLFIACVTLCSMHVDGYKLTHAGSLSSTASTASGEIDCCPFTESLRSVLPERSVLEVPAAEHTPVALVVGASDYEMSFHHFLTASGSSDPPLKRLRTLRI